MQNSFCKKSLVIGIILLFVGLSVIPVISVNIKPIDKVAYEDISNDRIEDRDGLKFDNRGYFLNNLYVEKDANLLNNNYNGPGVINPIWITVEGLVSYYFMRVYEDYIYVSGSKYIPEEETSIALLAKYNITDGELLWMKTWEGFHFRTNAKGLDIYNDSIYVTGWTGPPPGVLWWMDSFICKYDLDGNLLWSKLINETKYDFIDGVKVYDNYVYLCGYRNSGYEGSKSWILKYDTKGNKIWDKTYEMQEAIINKIYEFEIYDGYIYAEGQTDTYDENRQDVLVVKISLDGELIWFREWGGSGPDLGYGLDVYNDNIYVCGSGKDEYSDWGGHDILLKYDLDGKLQWDTTSFCSPGHTSDIIAYNGSVYTGGDFYRFEYDWDAVLYKIDEDSNLIWYLTYGPYDYFDVDCMDIYEDSIYIGGNGGGGFLMKYDSTLFSDNNKPYNPSKPSGPTSGKPGMEYTYSTNTTDSDGDLLSYDFLWGDWNMTTVEWYNPEEKVSTSYSWNEKGKYNVRIRARDECGFVSEWSEPLIVNIPRTRALHKYNWLDFLVRFPILKKLLNKFEQ